MHFNFQVSMTKDVAYREWTDRHTDWITYDQNWIYKNETSQLRWFTAFWILEKI